MDKIDISNVTDVNSLSFMRDMLDPVSDEWLLAEEKLRGILEDKYKDEMALCIETSMMPPAIKEGFTPYIKKLELLDTINSYGVFLRRAHVEYNETFKQIIPYILAVKDGEVFTMRRIKGDARLVGQGSIGIGGHIDLVDSEQEDIIYAGLMRELHEEVNIDENSIESIDLLGTIYDPSNAVGRDHLGLVFALNLNDKNITVKETESLKGGFYPIERLKNPVDDNIKMETWSQIIIDSIF
jgi:predicted NUDIX family phosphoesterase